jgi:hypothetical protein
MLWPEARRILCISIVPDAARRGTQVIVPYRDEDEKRHLKVMGDLGQIVPLVSPLLSALVRCREELKQTMLPERNGISETRG